MNRIGSKARYATQARSLAQLLSTAYRNFRKLSTKLTQAILISLQEDGLANGSLKAMESLEAMCEEDAKAVTVKPVAQQRLECLREQLRDYQAGHIRKIGCPYCGASNAKGESCCTLFVKAMQAILDHEEMLKQKEIIDRVQTPGTKIRLVN